MTMNLVLESSAMRQSDRVAVHRLPNLGSTLPSGGTIAPHAGQNPVIADARKRLATPLQSAVLDTAALQGWDWRTGLRLDELQSQPAEFAGMGRADCGDPNHRRAWFACSR